MVNLNLIGVTSLIPQFRKPENFRKDRLQRVQAQAPYRIFTLPVMVSYGVLLHKT